MQPIGPLMHEHRLIERMIRIIEAEVGRIEQGQKPDSVLVDQAVDFFRTYADGLHHGKEEDILFRELAKKPLLPEEKRILGELVEEHKRGRVLVRSIHETNAAVSRCENPAVVSDLTPLLRELIGFYPVHIAKEDKQFFFPIMKHFTRQEMNAMLAEFADFEARLIHQKYAAIVEEYEKSWG